MDYNPQISKPYKINLLFLLHDRIRYESKTAFYILYTR